MDGYGRIDEYKPKEKTYGTTEGLFKLNAHRKSELVKPRVACQEENNDDFES